MIRSFTTTALVGACFVGASVQAAEVAFSGSVDAGLISSLGTLEDSPKNTHSLEANLTADIKLSETVSAQLYAAALAGAVPTAGLPGAAGRWPGFAFDGAAITWKLAEDQSLVFGDIVYSKGTIGYYAMKRFSSVIRTEAILGVNYNVGGLSLYGGANDNSDSLMSFAAGYSIPLGEGMSLEPMADVTLGYSGNLPWAAGAQYKGKFSDLSLAASGSFFGADDSLGKHAYGYAIVVEPNYATDAWYLSSSFIFAPKAESMGKGEYPEYSFPLRHGRSYNAIMEDMIIYVEPGVNFMGGLMAFGLPVEYHEFDMSEEKTESLNFVPSFYINPAEGASITIWGEMDNPTADGADATYMAGLETIFKF